MTETQTWILNNLKLLNLTEDMKQKEGFTRLSFSKEEQHAHVNFIKIAKQLDMKTWKDEVGNSWALWEVEANQPTIVFGSHLDSVKSGGGYDGVSGIVCALSAIHQLKQSGIEPRYNIAIIAFIAEESARFGLSTIGSKTIVGNVKKEVWEKITDQQNISVKQAMESVGVNWETFDQAKNIKIDIDHFIELHVEQGNYLYKNNLEIGVVNGIAAPVRLIITVKGEANHTGTTLMEERKDAFVAISPLIPFVSERARSISEKNADPLVATVSTISLEPNAFNVIPGKIKLGIDIRSVNDQQKSGLAEEIKQFCQELEKSTGVTINVKTLIDEPSVLLDRSVIKRLEQTCQQMNLEFEIMNSGAGHDTMNMAKRWPSGMVFIPSVDGISHHPDEYTPIENLVIGADLLKTYIENY